MKIENCATSDSLVPTSHVSYNYCDGKWKIKSYTLNPRCERRRDREKVRSSGGECCGDDDFVQKSSKRKNLVIWLGLCCDEVRSVPHCPNVSLHTQQIIIIIIRTLKCWQGN